MYQNFKQTINLKIFLNFDLQPQLLNLVKGKVEKGFVKADKRFSLTNVSEGIELLYRSNKSDDKKTTNPRRIKMILITKIFRWKKYCFQKDYRFEADEDLLNEGIEVILSQRYPPIDLLEQNDHR